MNQRFYNICLVLYFAGSCLGQQSNELDADKIEQKLKQNIPGLDNFNASQIPNEEDVERLLREKCEKNGGGEEAFNALKTQLSEIKTCLEDQLNATAIQMEIDESIKTGSMDEVFGKYCRKYPEINKCIDDVTDKVKPCLDPQEQETLNKTLKIVDELITFLCYKDGDRIAMFIAEGGIECLKSKKEELQQCANKTIGSRIPTDLNVKSLPMFLFTERECNDFEAIRSCTNKELETCKDSTPANIVDALFKFLKKQLPCDNVASGKVTAKEGSGSSAVNTSVSLVVLSLALLYSSLF